MTNHDLADLKTHQVKPNLQSNWHSLIIGTGTAATTAALALLNVSPAAAKTTPAHSADHKRTEHRHHHSADHKKAERRHHKLTPKAKITHSILFGTFCATVCESTNGELLIEPDSTIDQNGIQVGMYVDDQDPEQVSDTKRYAAEAASKGWRYIIDGIPQGTPDEVIPGATYSAVEEYPYADGVYFGPPPCGHAAYIIQGAGTHWLNSPTPSDSQTNTLLHQTEDCDPDLIITYNNATLS